MHLSTHIMFVQHQSIRANMGIYRLIFIGHEDTILCFSILIYLSNKRFTFIQCFCMIGKDLDHIFFSIKFAVIFQTTIMPTESLRNSELNGKRKGKNKVPKRLRRKNKQNDINIEENTTNNIPTTGNIQFTFDKLQ